MRAFSVVMCLFVIITMGYGQAVVVQPPTVVGEASDYLWQVTDSASGGPTRVGSEIRNRTFTSITSDTTQYVSTYRAKSLWFHVSVKDSATILTAYQTSLDGITWLPGAALDSVKSSTGGAFNIKSYNLSAAADSCRFIRLILPFNTAAYAKGTTTPTYNVLYTIKRN